MKQLHDTQMQAIFPLLPEGERRWAVNPDNPDCPFHEYVGNRDAIEILSIAAYHAMSQEILDDDDNGTGYSNHLCENMNFALLGPASAGKTMLAKLFAKTLRLPFVEISPRSVSSATDVLNEIANVCEKFVVNGVSLRLMEVDGVITLPPIVVLLDEAHALRTKVVDALLKATEVNDATMVTEPIGKGKNQVGPYRVDCGNVLWMLATTDRGKLFDAFDTRFDKINLNLYSQEEIATIIMAIYPEWDMDVCRLVAKFSSRIPREAKSFAQSMQMTYNMYPESWDKVALKVAKFKGIDEYGMSLQRLEILKALGQQGPMSMSRIESVAGCKEEELRKFVLPWLLAETPDQKPMITVANRHSITEHGLAELDKRGIENLGEEAMAKSIRRPMPVSDRFKYTLN